MSKAPSMPMYWDAYLADTTHLSTEEHGAYLLLLAAMWRRNGWVPDSDEDNARIVGLSRAKWRKMKARLTPFLVFDGGEISQEKLQKTWKKTQENIDKNRENGAKGGRPKANKNNDVAKANGCVSVNPNETIPEPEPEPEKKREPKGSLKEVGPTFEDFWLVVPRKRAKGDARKAWARAVKRAAPQAIIDGMARYAKEREGQDEKYTAYPASWLNADRWQDEPDTGSDAKHSNFYAEIERMMGNGGTSDSDEIRGSDAEHHLRSHPVPETIQATGTYGRCDGGPDDTGHSREPEQSYLSLVKPRRFGGPRF